MESLTALQEAVANLNMASYALLEVKIVDLTLGEAGILAGNIESLRKKIFAINRMLDLFAENR